MLTKIAYTDSYLLLKSIMMSSLVNCLPITTLIVSRYFTLTMWQCQWHYWYQECLQWSQPWQQRQEQTIREWDFLNITSTLDRLTFASWLQIKLKYLDSWFWSVLSKPYSHYLWWRANLGKSLFYVRTFQLELGLLITKRCGYKPYSNGILTFRFKMHILRFFVSVEK